MQQKCKNIRKYAQKCLERAVIYAREAHKICHYTESTVLNFSTGMQHMQIISTKYADICNKNERICSKYTSNTQLQIPKDSQKFEYAQNLPLHRLQHAYYAYAKYAECMCIWNMHMQNDIFCTCIFHMHMKNDIFCIHIWNMRMDDST